MAQAGTTTGAVRDPADIRNVLLTGGSGGGKTTLTERLLLAAGEISRAGAVEDGTTTSDWREEEIHHKHSLYTTVLHLEHEGHLVNMIDAPGMSDFIGHAIAAMPAVETAAVVLDAAAVSARGIDPVARRMMAVAKQRNLPRMVIVNKIDDPTADPEAVYEQLRDELGPELLAVNLPAADRSGVVKVFDEEGQGDPLFSSEEDAHQAIIEQIVEMQDDLMTQYLEDGDDKNLDKSKVHDAFEAALRDAHLVPVCFVSAKTGAGVDHLLHVFASLLPSPLEGNPRPFTKKEADDEVEFTPEPDASKPVLAHVFKVTSDRHLGKLGVFRVHQGTVSTHSQLIIDDQKKPIRVNHLLKRQGKSHVEVDSVGPGDIAAITKLDEVHFDATLHQDHDLDSVHLRPLPLPQPMFGLAIELSGGSQDETKFSAGMHRLLAEDPCLRLDRIKATKQTVLRGLGEMHLRVALERLKAETGIAVETSTPKVAYRETITAKAEGHHRHKKQTGGAGQFGEVYLRVEPLPADDVAAGTALEFVNATVGGSIPRGFMPAIEKGVRDVMDHGAVAGYPVMGVKVEVYDGKHHAVDSKEIAFITAGKKAFIDAVSKARPALLEPFVTLEITCPQSAMGDISSNLSTKRGRVQDTRMGPGDLCTVVAQAPMGEVQGFGTELKSITGGAGSYVMEYSHDEETPPHIQQQVISAFEGHADEE